MSTTQFYDDGRDDDDSSNSTVVVLLAVGTPLLLHTKTVFFLRITV